MTDKPEEVEEIENIEDMKVAQPLDKVVKKKKNPPTVQYEKYENIQQFKKSTIGLIQEDMIKTRYCIRFNAATGSTELSSTNDKKLFKFETTKPEELNKLHDINLNVMRSIIQKVNLGRKKNPNQNQQKGGGKKGGHGGGKKKSGGKRKKKRKKRR